MYQDFYKFTARPFQLSPDPRYFFRSKGHKRAQAYMRYGLQQEQGFIVVTGDVGTGKTMLVNNLFRELDVDSTVGAKIVSSNLKDVDLLRLIAAEFDIPFERSSKASLLHKLENFFKSCRDEGKRVLLVIDEAQNLPRSALEELRMLSNFEYQGTPLVQSFLLGQREFRSVLRAPGLEQLRQRVIAAYHLKPLTAAEVKSYVNHRLGKVGWVGDPEISEEAYEVLFECTGGVPRRINTLFDRVLLNSFLDESHAIDADTIRTVFDEVREEQGEIDEDVPDPAAEREAQTGGTESHNEAPIEIKDQQEKLERYERQIAEMQRTMDDLNRRVLQYQALQDPNSNRTRESRMLPGEYPIWTIVFVLLISLVAIGSAVGYWLLSA